MRVKNLMTKTVVTCRAADTLNDAARLMWEKDCGFLPVVDQDFRLVGLITDRDICMAAYTQGVPLQKSAVESAMSRSPRCSSPEDDVEDAELLMRRYQVRRLPVVDREGRLCGVMTISDLARSSQTNALRKTLTGARVARTLAEISETRPRVAAIAAE
jgi:CBS domain-containing protein